MSWRTVVLILTALLVAVNGFTGGAVEEGAHDIAFSEERQDMRNTLTCLAGIMMYTPVREISYPMPSIFDIILSGVLTFGALVLLKKVNIEYKWMHGALIFVGIWVLLRAFLISSPVVMLKTPIPSSDDIIFSAFITGAIITVLHFANVKYNWKHGIGLFVVIWALYRFIGWILIQQAGDSCEVLLSGTAESLSGIILLGSLGCVPIIWKFIVKVKG